MRLGDNAPGLANDVATESPTPHGRESAKLRCRNYGARGGASVRKVTRKEASRPSVPLTAAQPGPVPPMCRRLFPNLPPADMPQWFTHHNAVPDPPPPQQAPPHPT